MTWIALVTAKRFFLYGGVCSKLIRIKSVFCVWHINKSRGIKYVKSYKLVYVYVEVTRKLLMQLKNILNVTIKKYKWSDSKSRSI